MAKAVINLVDSGGQKGKTVSSDLSITDYADFLKAYTDAGYKSGSTVTFADLTSNGQDALAGSNIDKKMVITMKDTATGQVYRHAIAAPKSSVLITEQGETGERLTKAAGDAYAAAFATKVSISTIVFLSGRPVQRP